MFVVYDKIDGHQGCAAGRHGARRRQFFPKQLQQIEAVGINNGPDGKPDTTDDLNLGIVDVKWSLEEYRRRSRTTTLRYVGTLDQNGPLHAQRGRTESEAHR